MTTFSTSTRLSRGLGFRRRAGFRSGSGSFGTGGRTRALTGIAGSVVLATAMTLPTATLADAATANPAATVAVDLSADVRPIDPRIYGLNFATAAQLKDLRVTANRSGGNTTSTYNWRLNADNKGNDWYFESIGEDSATPGGAVDTFMTQTASAGAAPEVTIPMMGRVAKLGPNRGKLASYSVAKYGPQQDTDWQWMPDAGNGVRANGSLIVGNPDDASTTSTAADAKAWVSQIVAQRGLASPTNPRAYLYDNEPGLWAYTHRDMVATNPTMQQYYDRMVSYGTALRAADPKAQLVGPEGWGLLDVQYSPADQQYARDHGWGSYPDRDAHGGTDFYPWLLKKLAANQAATGQRLLDVLSVHWYPQSGEDGNDSGAAMAQRRNRSTRSLWDPNYTDESWMAQKVALIPKLKAMVAANYPGTAVGITEYSWGAENSMSGAVAQADVLGIFGRTGLDLANRWTTPATGSPVYQAIRLYRNYDGLGSAFGSTSVRASVANPDNVAAFAATRSDGATTIMLLNKYVSGKTPVKVTVANRAAAGAADSAQVWQLAGGSTTRLANTTLAGNAASLTLPAQSVTLLVLPKPGTASASGTVSQSAPAPGSAVGWTATTTAGGSAISNATVDVNLVGADGSSVALAHRTGVNLAARGSLPLSGTLTAPAKAQAYRLSVKVASGASVVVSEPAAACFTVTQPKPVITTSATSGTGKVKTPVTSTATVKVAAAPVSNLIVDVEVYDANGQQVAQTFAEGQSFTAGQSRNYPISWTPPRAGKYTVKIGIFTAGWSSMLQWNDGAGTVTVT